LRASGGARTFELPAALVSMTPCALSQTKPPSVITGPETKPDASMIEMPSGCMAWATDGPVTITKASASARRDL
jgi:hypothetical protein